VSFQKCGNPRYGRGRSIYFKNLDPQRDGGFSRMRQLADPKTCPPRVGFGWSEKYICPHMAPQ